MIRTIRVTDAIAAGQVSVYIPAKAANARLLLGFHGAGALAETESDRGSVASAARIEAFHQAGFAQLWMNGGRIGTKLSSALSVGATSMTVSDAVEPGQYTIDYGYNGVVSELVTVSGTGTTVAISAAARAHTSGAVVMSNQTSGWGSDADIDMASRAWTWAKATLPIKTDKLVAYGNSAGFAWAAAWMHNNSGQVLALAGTFPVVDIKDIHDNNRGGLQVQLQAAAYNGSSGTAPSNAWFAARSPVSLTGSTGLRATPQRLWISSDDPTALPNLAYNYASAIGASTVDLGAKNHAFSQPLPYGAVPHADVAAWLAAHS